MRKRIQKMDWNRESRPSRWWMIAIPPAALAIAWGVRRIIQSGVLSLPKQPAAGMVPATGVAAPPSIEMERADFRHVSNEMTVQEMAGFKTNRPEPAESHAAAPPSASEDSPVSISTTPEQAAGILPIADMDTQPVQVQPAARQTPTRAFQPDLPSDDFRVIEGIGPSITAILHNAGVQTFQQLAEAPVEELREILRQAGLTHLADPATWPEQAQMAADEKWDELTQLQNSLRQGRRKE